LSTLHVAPSTFQIRRTRGDPRCGKLKLCEKLTAWIDPVREVIFNRLWIGNARDARDVPEILKYGIAAVVDLAIEEPVIHFPRDIVYCRFPLIDGAGNSHAVLGATIDVTAQLIRSQGPTLVACGGGMSRAPAVVAAAIATVEGLTPDEALVQIAARGPHDVSPSLWSEIEMVTRT
jgi:hypothetical protein